MKTWPSLLLACALQVFLALSASAQETTQSIAVPALDLGYYDQYGERDPRQQEALAGRHGYEPARSPLRGFFAFDIPQIQGTITNAYLRFAQYASSQAETVHLHQISTPMHLVRNGGFGLTNVHTDLGDGPLYGSTNVRSGFFFGLNVALTPDAISAIQVAQGQTFGIGMTLATLDHQSSFDERLRISWSELIIEATVPQRPAFYQEPTRLFSWSGIAYTAAASGTRLITYQWYLNGMPYGQPATWPTINLALSTNPQPVYVVASNAFGMTTSSVVQASLPAASFNLELTNLTVRAGDDLYLYNGAVTFHAGPPRAIWLKDGIPWNNPPWGYNGAATNAILSLQDAQLGDTGDYSIVASNSIGMATSTVVRIQVVETPPVYWAHPKGTTSAVGQDFLLYAVVKSSPPAEFQWFHNGTPLLATNGSTLQVFDPGLTASGDYYLVASNAMGSATSQVAHVQIYAAPPLFNLEPADLTGYAGARLTASVSVSGTPQPLLRWYINDALFHTGYNSDLFIEAASSSHAGSLYCVAENASGVTTSRVATITVLQVPPILQPLPATMSVLAGATDSLRVFIANWETPHHIQWQFNGQDIAGANAADLVLVNMATNMAGNYRVIVTNAFGATTSSVVAVSVQTQPPTFPWQPLGVTVVEGQTININVTAIGAPPPRLFLLRDGQPISAVSNPNGFTIPGAALSDAGNYQVLASNFVGTAVSGEFRVNVQRAGPFDRWTQRNPLPQAVTCTAWQPGMASSSPWAITAPLFAPPMAFIGPATASAPLPI